MSLGSVVGVGLGLGFAVLLAVMGLYALTFRWAAEFRLPLVHDLIEVITREETARKDQTVKDNVAALARKLGEVQAQMLRLDALGERVSEMAGIRPEEFTFKDVPGRGGAAPTAGEPMSVDDLRQELDRIAAGVQARADFLDVIESELVEAQVRRALLPQNTPVTVGFVGSPYGMRVDPFTGQRAMHAGIDFAAPAGTPISAAAGGVVTEAGFDPEFGKRVEIDHGNDLRTLYAHASKLEVKVGDIVRRGQKIAEVGSTGRSTGSHLHFEVHVRGQPQNPARFLLAQNAGSPFAPLATVPSRSADVRGLVRADAASN